MTCADVVILGLLAMRPEGRDAYASAEGVLVIVVGAIVSVIAYRIMLRIVPHASNT